MRPGPVNTAVFLASLVLVALQVALMQALAEAQGHHFAYVVIALALLGFGGSGTALSLWRSRALARGGRLQSDLLLSAGAGCIAVLPLARLAAARVDFPLLFIDWRAWGPLLLAAGLACVPFFLGALFLGLTFMRDTRGIGRLYAANLLGSAAGAAGGLGLLLWLPAERVFPLMGAVLACASLVLAIGAGRAAASLAVFALGLAGAWLMPGLPVSAYKPVSHAVRLPGAEILADERHPMGRVQVVRSPALRHAPGLSLNFGGEIPATGHVYVNGEGLGAFLPPSASGGHILDHGVQALPLALAAPRRALVLPAGAGASVGLLLSRQGVDVDAVEPHPVVAKLLRTAYPSSDVRLNVISEDCRAFLGRSREPYELILLPPLGAFGGGIGLQAQQENYLLTREGFAALWNALARGEGNVGMLSFCVHLDQPPRQSLRLLTLVADAMRRAGVSDPSRHVAAVRSWEMLAVAVSTRPFDEAARLRLEGFARSGGFDRVWVPGRGPAPEDSFHLMLDDILPRGFEAVLAGAGARFVRDYPFDIAPPEDGRPYFHQFIRWDRLGDVRRLLGQDCPAFVEMGAILVALTAAALAVAAVVLILLPLWRLSGKDAAKLGTRAGTAAVLAYFGAIGVGFMFLEMVWIQRFTLFWGQPLSSAAGVLAALLCGMGAGSALSAGVPCAPRAIRWVLAGILALIGLHAAGLPHLMAAGLGWPEPLKWVVGLGVLSVSAVVLGLPFPLALRALGASRPELVPWAWGVNGCLSVLAAPLAVLTAMQGGFGAVSAVAATAYLLAFGSASQAAAASGEG
jgi:hypothetical protein